MNETARGLPRLRIRIQLTWWLAVVTVCILVNHPGLLSYNYRTARAYPMRRRSAAYWSWKCAAHHMKIDGFLAEKFRLEMARHGAEEDGGELVETAS